MEILHKIGHVINFIFNKIYLLFFVAFLIVMPLLLGISNTFVNEENIKQVIDEGQLYSNLVDRALDVFEVEDESVQNQLQQNNPRQVIKQEIPTKPLREVISENNLIDGDELVAAITKSFDEAYVETKINTMIDAVYAYLRNETPELQFSLSFEDRSDEITKNFKEFLLNSLDKAPVCSQQQLLEIELSNDGFNPLESPCVPPGGQLQTEVSKFIDEFFDESLFQKPLTQDDFEISTFELRMAKIAYTIAELAPILLWGIYFALALIVVVTSKTIYRGLKTVGVVSVLWAVALIVILQLASPVSFMVEKMSESKDGGLSAADVARKEIMEPLVTAMWDIVKGNILLMLVALLFVGIALFIIGIILKRHHVEHLELGHHEFFKEEDDPKKSFLDNTKEKMQKQKDKAKAKTSKVRTKTKTITKTRTKQIMDVQRPQEHKPSAEEEPATNDASQEMEEDKS